MIDGVEVRVGRKGEGVIEVKSSWGGGGYLQFRRPGGGGGMFPPPNSDKGGEEGQKFPDFARRH